MVGKVDLVIFRYGNGFSFCVFCLVEFKVDYIVIVGFGEFVVGYGN